MPDDVERQLAAFGETLGAHTPEPIQPDTASAGDPPTAAGPTATSPKRRWWAVAGAAAIVVAALGGFVALNSRSAEAPAIAPADTGDDASVTANSTPPSSEPGDAPHAPVTSEPIDTAPEPTDEQGPWTRECVEQPGEPRNYGPDEFADEPFGPLAPEPGLRILYADSAVTDGSFSAPVSSVSRIPGGTFIRMTSVAADRGQIVVVVDDDGSIRWRRCIPEMDGWSMIVDGAGGLAHLQMYPTATHVEEWWTFDLATGGHSVADGPPPEAAGTEPSTTEIDFALGSDSPFLRRVAEDGSERWRREDLVDPGDEGFRIAGSGADGHPVLVRACLGEPVDPVNEGSRCASGLFGLDADDGSTIWQLDGNYGVSLAADGYAIVTVLDPSGMTSAHTLIDLDTGAPIPGGISDAPGAFLVECCGGYDYNRVQRHGSLAWSVASHWLDVWFPADHPGPGYTVDVLGGDASPHVVAQRHWTSVEGDCPDGLCTPIRAIGRGFSPGSTVTVRCWQADGTDWVQVAGEAELDVGPDGSAAADGPCTTPFGITGTTAHRVTFDDIASNALDG